MPCREGLGAQPVGVVRPGWPAGRGVERYERRASIATLPCAAAGAAANRNSAPSARADSAAGMAEKAAGAGRPPAAERKEKREEVAASRGRRGSGRFRWADGPPSPGAHLAALCSLHLWTGTTGSVAKMRLLERLMKTQEKRLIGALLLERHEKWQLETQPSLSTPKASSFNAFSHYQDW